MTNESAHQRRNAMTLKNVANVLANLDASLFGFLTTFAIVGAIMAHVA